MPRYIRRVYTRHLPLMRLLAGGAPNKQFFFLKKKSHLEQIDNRLSLHDLYGTSFMEYLLFPIWYDLLTTARSRSLSGASPCCMIYSSFMPSGTPPVCLFCMIYVAHALPVLDLRYVQILHSLLEKRQVRNQIIYGTSRSVGGVKQVVRALSPTHTPTRTTSRLSHNKCSKTNCIGPQGYWVCTTQTVNINCVLIFIPESKWW